MNSDYAFEWFVGIVLLAIVVPLVVILAGGIYQGATGGGQATHDITQSYALPPELVGSRVYRLTPAGFGQTIYAITRGDEVVGVEWSTGGKHETRVRVIQEVAK